MRFRVEKEDETYERYEKEQQPPVIKDIRENRIGWVWYQLKEFNATSAGFDFIEFQIDEVESQHKHAAQDEKEFGGILIETVLGINRNNAEEVEGEEEVDHGLYIKKDTP